MLPVLLHFGPFTLHTYGLMAALGILAGLKTLTRQAALDGFSGKEVEESLYSLMVYLTFAGIFGARIFYVATHWDEFSGDFAAIFKIWEGGLIFYGGLIAAAGAFLIWFSKNKPIFKDWKLLADWIAPALAFGHALGRLGCFSAGCCYGKFTLQPWAVIFRNPDSLAPQGIPLHPTQLYEFSFLAALGVYLLHRLSSARKSAAPVRGIVFTDYLILYSLGRFALEFFRGDEARILTLSPGQIFSIVLFAAALFLRFFLTKQARDRIIKKV